MSPIVVEVFSAPASAAFRENPRNLALVQPGYDILAKTDGQIKSYYGLQHEDQATLHILVAWESFEQHKTLMDDAPTYKTLGAALAPVIDTTSAAPKSMYHVQVSSEPYKAIEAPVLEIATFTLNEGQSKSALESILRELETAMNAQGEAGGVIYAIAGQVVEKDNVLAILIGWTTVEAHWDLVNKHPTFIDLIKRAKEIAQIQLVHVPLALYSPSSTKL